jgi:flavodoxin
MRIQIVIHTQSGHTANVARAIASKLNTLGHETDIHMLRTSGKVAPRSSKFEIRNIPEPAGYDVVLFGGPVWAFTASPVILSCINEVHGLNGKKVLCFLTMGLPFKFTGGERGLKAMADALELCGAQVLPGEALHYFFKANKANLDAMVERICGKITA